MAVDTIPEPPANSAFWVYDEARDKEVMVGTKEQCDLYATKNPFRFKVYPNN